MIVARLGLFEDRRSVLLRHHAAPHPFIREFKSLQKAIAKFNRI